MKLGAVLCRLLLIGACLLVALGGVTLFLRIPLLAYALLALIAWRWRKGRFGTNYAYGTAQVASFLDLAKWDFLSPEGLLVGTAGYAASPTRLQALRRLFSPLVSSAVACRAFLSAFHGARWKEECLVRVPSVTHVAAFAPTGRGKGVSLVVPTLLSYSGSIICTDPKPELFSISARHRKKRFKHDIVLIDPYLTAGARRTDALNPLQFIDPARLDFFDACRDLACAIVVRDDKEMQPFFNDMATIVLTAVIAYTCAFERVPARRNLQTVHMIVSSSSLLAEVVEAMQNSEEYGGGFKTLGGTLSWLKSGSDEQASVMSTLARHVNFLISPAVSAATAKTTFDIGKLRQGRMSVYLCVPPARLSSNAGLLRLFITSFIHMLISGGPDDRNKVLFLLDEAGHLGRLEILETAVTLLRGYGISLFLVFQSIRQLATCYGDKALTFMDNIDTRIFWGTNAYENAEAISKLAGEYSLVVETLNRSDSYSHSSGSGRDGGQANRSISTSSTQSEIARAVARADEVIRMPEDYAFFYHRNKPLIPLKLLRYYDHPAFRRGGTGRQAGMGLLAVVTSALFLCISWLVAGGCAVVAEAWARHSAAASRVVRQRYVPPPAGRTIGRRTPYGYRSRQVVPPRRTSPGGLNRYRR